MFWVFFRQTILLLTVGDDVRTWVHTSEKPAGGSTLLGERTHYP